MLFSLFIPLLPIPKGRPRFNAKHVFTPSRTKKFENNIKLFAKRGMIEQKVPIFKKEISVFLVFHFKFPLSKKPTDSKKIIPCIKREDLDNLVKSVLDGCEKVCYTNDKLVTQLVAFKIYSDKEGISIGIDKANNKTPYEMLEIFKNE